MWKSPAIESYPIALVPGKFDMPGFRMFAGAFGASFPLFRDVLPQKMAGHHGFTGTWGPEFDEYMAWSEKLAANDGALGVKCVNDLLDFLDANRPLT